MQDKTWPHPTEGAELSNAHRPISEQRLSVFSPRSKATIVGILTLASAACSRGARREPDALSKFDSEVMMLSARDHP
jgi:hypothetical protein